MARIDTVVSPTLCGANWSQILYLCIQGRNTLCRTLPFWHAVQFFDLFRQHSWFNATSRCIAKWFSYYDVINAFFSIFSNYVLSQDTFLKCFCWSLAVIISHMPIFSIQVGYSLKLQQILKCFSSEVMCSTVVAWSLRVKVASAAATRNSCSRPVWIFPIRIKPISCTAGFLNTRGWEAPFTQIWI